MRALVTDVHTRAGVAGVRAFGHAGIDVIALGPRRSSAGLWSRHRVARSVGPDPVEDPDGFTAALVHHAERHGPVAVYPAQEASIGGVVEAASRTAAAVLPYPGPDALLALRDKRTLPSLADRAGLAVPRTLAEVTPEEVAGRRLPVACVVKRTALGVQARARVVNTDARFRAVLAAVPAGERVILQELVRGPLVGLAVVVDRGGEVIARLQQVALRTYPADAGGTSLAASTAPDDDLTDAAARLLEAAGYWGLAHLQFIQTASGPVLIDVNPRFYGSMALALACGVNLAEAWHAVTVDTPLAAGTSGYRTGVSYRSLRNEFAAATRERSPGVLLRRAPRPTSGAFWARDDPVASALLTAHAASIPLGRALLRK